MARTNALISTTSDVLLAEAITTSGIRGIGLSWNLTGVLEFGGDSLDIAEQLGNDTVGAASAASRWLFGKRGLDWDAYPWLPAVPWLASAAALGGFLAVVTAGFANLCCYG